MVNYKLGKIYKITSAHTEKIYIGSTCKQYLSQRKTKHIKCYKDHSKGGKSLYMTSFELIKLGDIDTVLLEIYPCKSKDELHARERHYIEQFKNIAVNKFIPTRTKKEYNDSHK